MEEFKPYQRVMVVDFTVNSTKCDCWAEFMRYLKDDKCEVRINSIIVKIPVSKVRNGDAYWKEKNSK